MTDVVLPLARILDLTAEEGSKDHFIGPNDQMLPDRIYGGQILAQALKAARLTVEGDRPVHSMHAYFIRGGAPGTPLEYQVERLSDGRTLSHRRVQALQTNRILYSSIFSFQENEPGLVHQGDMPSVPGPDEVSPGQAQTLPATELGGFEVRPVLGDDAAQLGGKEFGRRAMWMRVSGDVPDDPAFHQQALAFASDFAIFLTSMEIHNVVFGQSPRGTLITSLDHALWWHSTPRVDEWLLLVQEAPQAGNSRSMNAAYFYTPDGKLVASVAQEILFRVPQD